MIRTTTVAVATDIGSTAAVKTRVNTDKVVVMPSWARNIESIEPWISVDVYDADKLCVAKVTLESQDIALDPCIVFTNPIGGYYATTGQPFQPENPVYKVNCPLKGGEEISVYGTMLVSHTGPAYAGCTFTITDQPPAERQRFYQVGTVTDTGTSAATVKGTAYNIHGSNRIVEVLGIVGAMVNQTANAILGYFSIDSDDFVRACPLDYGFEPVLAGVGTVDGPRLQGPTRYDVDVPTHTSCTLQDYCTFDAALDTDQGKFISGVAFNKAGR